MVKSSTTGVRDVSESMRDLARKSTTSNTYFAVSELANLGRPLREATKVASATARAVIFGTDTFFGSALFHRSSIPQSSYVTVLPSENTDQLTEAANEMLSFCSLERGWDGPDSVSPSKRAIAEAYSFIQNRLLAHKDAPEPTAYADGEVGWYWQKGDDVLSIVFVGAGRYAYYGKVKGAVVRSPIREYGNTIPDDLSAALNNI